MGEGQIGADLTMIEVLARLGGDKSVRWLQRRLAEDSGSLSPVTTRATDRHRWAQPPRPLPAGC
jgi:hypothetical protein